MVMLISRGTEEQVKKYHLKWIGQRKYDGVRCVAFCNGIVCLKGRNGTDLTKRFPKIVEELKGLIGVFDGEIVCDTFKHTCMRAKTENKLKSSLLVDEYPANLMVFDLIEDKPYAYRYVDLNDVLSETEHIKIVESSKDLIGLWEKAKSGKWEGIVIKNPMGMWEDKRTKSQIKIKDVKSKDIDFTKYEINPAGVKCSTADDFYKVQVTGSNSLPVKDMIDETGSCKIEVEYLNVMDSGKLRMPVFKEIKTTKTEVLQEYHKEECSVGNL